MNFLPPVGRPNGGRLGNRKDRTGCKTCKKRKIKCDESKPFCRRCTSTGRECGGYATLELRLVCHGSTDTPAALNSPLPETRLDVRLVSDHEEYQAFNYFVSGSSLAIAGQFDAELWSRSLPQLSHTMPAIRHAAIAIGSLLREADAMHSCLETRKPSRTASYHNYNFAVYHYHKAIQSTLNALETEGGSPLLASTTCVLFFCIEALQGHEHEALQIFERGQKAQIMPTKGNSNDTIRYNLASTFSRLAVQWSMFGASAIQLPYTSTDYSMPISSVPQAQTELINLISQTLNVSTVGRALKFPDAQSTSGQVPNDDFQQLQLRQNSIKTSLNHWKTRLDTYQNTYRHVGISCQSYAYSILRLWYGTIVLWLAGSLDRSEMVFDNHLSLARVILVEAGEALDRIEQQRKTTSFTFEMGFIPPLYILAVKCRQPLLRRKALSLLRRAPAQEGLWNRSIMVQVIERAIELEEGSDGFIEDLPADLHHVIVPETMRCKWIKIGLRTTSEDGMVGDLVEFYMEPYGLKQGGAIHREFFCSTVMK